MNKNRLQKLSPETLKNLQGGLVGETNTNAVTDQEDTLAGSSTL